MRVVTQRVPTTVGGTQSANRPTAAPGRIATTVACQLANACNQTTLLSGNVTQPAVPMPGFLQT